MGQSESWTRDARRYIAFKSRRYVDLARDACKSPAIGAFLKALQVVVEAGPIEYQPAVRELSTLGSKLLRGAQAIDDPDEAAVVELGCIMEIANLANEPEKADGPSGRFIVEFCLRAIELSTERGFGECEGHFRTLWGIREIKLNHWDEAEKSLTRAVRVLRCVLDEEPEGSGKGELANALHAQARLLYHLRQYHDALRVCHEALEMLRTLPAWEQEQYQSFFGAVNLTMADVLDEMREPDRGRACYEAAYEVYDRLAGTDQNSTGWELHAPSKATVRNNQTVSWLESGNVEEKDEADIKNVLKYAQEAMMVFAELAKRWPAVYAVRLAMAESNYGKVLHELGRLEESERAFLGALEHLRRLPEGAKVRESKGILATWQGLASVLRGQGRFGEARSLLKDNLDMVELLASRQPEVFQTLHTGWINNLANVLEDIRRAEGPNEALEGEILRLSAQAIRKAEEGQNDDLLHLEKGGTTASYRRLTTTLAGTGRRDELFRSLAAVREGPVRALGSVPAHGLDAALDALQAAAQRIGRSLRIVVAEALFDGKSLFALMDTDSGDFNWKTVTVNLAATRLLKTVFEIFEKEVDPESGTQRYERIQEAGAVLWRCLPTLVRKALEPSSNGDVLISGDLFWTLFPWEAIHMGEKQGGWLGLLRPLARWGPLTAPALDRLQWGTLGDGSRAAMVICPWKVPGSKDLDGALDEAGQVQACLQKVLPDQTILIGEDATVEKFMKLFPANISLLHYCGHGDRVGSEEVLVLRQQLPGGVCKGFFGRKEITDVKSRLGYAGPLLNGGPLVVLNSCMTGWPRAYGGQREDLGATFLEEGAQAVIVSPTPIFDSMGSLFGRKLYVSNSSSVGMADIFMAVRKGVELDYRHSEPLCWPGWTLFHYHGNPYATLPKPESSLCDS